MHTVGVGRFITSTEAAGRARGQNSCTRTHVHGALRNQPRRIEADRNAVHEALRVAAVLLLLLLPASASRGHFFLPLAARDSTGTQALFYSLRSQNSDVFTSSACTVVRGKENPDFGNFDF